MNDRDELSALIHNASVGRPEAEALWENGPECVRLADAIISAGYRRDPEVTEEMEMAAWEAWSKNIGTERMRAALEAALGVRS